ncbi:MAG: DUF3098 domain-containing protein [Flavobacteriaceae bacterium]|nr:DUF3098 domain-containing protein [Flavobacteriaceae bacterium]
MNQNNKKSKKIIFKRKNYLILYVSIFFIILGFILMIGGGSQNPFKFNPEIFNFQRIRLAPTIVILGFSIAVYSILYTNNSKND